MIPIIIIILSSNQILGKTTHSQSIVYSKEDFES